MFQDSKTKNHWMDEESLHTEIDRLTEDRDFWRSKCTKGRRPTIYERIMRVPPQIFWPVAVGLVTILLYLISVVWR